VAAIGAVALLSAAVAMITTSLVSRRPAAPELIPQPIHVFDVDGGCDNPVLPLCPTG